MVAPSGNSQSFQVLLEFLTNTQTYDQIIDQTKNIVGETKRAQEFTRLYSEELKKTYPELYRQIQAEKDAAEAEEKHTAAIKKQNAEISVQIRNLRAQAREITTSVRLLQDSAGDIDRFAKPLATGGALLVGGIFAAANQYVKSAKVATQTTKEWVAAQADLEQSGQRIGEILAQEALPLLKEAAVITRQVANVIERNPQIVGLALKGGLIALTLGTIGKAISSGIRLVADLKLDAALTLQNQAANLQLIASENQLRAAGIQAEASGASTAAGGGFLSKAKSAAPLAGTIGVGVLFSTAIFAGIIKLDLEVSKFIKNLTGLETPLLKLSNYLHKLKGDVEETGTAVAKVKPQEFLGGSKETQDSIVKAFGDWQKEDARIVSNAMEARKKIVTEGEAEINRINASYIAKRPAIATQVAAANEKAEQAYNQFLKDKADERKGIAKDSEENIRKIQADAQKEREEIEKTYHKSARKAIQERDALALQDAQDTRDEALAKAGQDTNKAIQKEKEETARRLAEFDSRFAQEREQRYAEYKQQRKENAERLKEFDKQHQDEIKAARDANAQKLREAAEAANRERTEKRNQFITQLSDLGVTFNSERQLRNNAYNAMLSDVQIWLSRMGAAFTGATGAASSLGTASGGVVTNPNFSGSGLYGTHDVTGYAYKGMYRMAQNGQREFVLGGNDTRSAENAIGGQLTQSNVAQMISLFAAMRGSMQVVDNTTFGKDLTTRQIRDLKEIQTRQLDKLLGRY
jgi:hypothetical protein